MKLKKIIVNIFLITIAFLLCLKFATNNSNKTSFNYAGKLPASAAYQKANLISDTEVLITGGLMSGADFKSGSKTAWIYSIKDKKTNKTTDMNLKHLFHKTFKMSNGNIIIADINGIEIYDIKEKKFKLLKTKPKERYKEFYNYKYALMPNDLLVILGGRIEKQQKNGATSADLNIGEIIDLKNDKLIKEFKIKGNGFGLVNLQNGDLLIIGGKEKTTKAEKLSNAIYILNSKTFNLSKWGELPTSIINPFCFLTNDNKLVIIGGEVFKNNIEWKKFNYIQTKGSDNIYVVDLATKEIVSKNLKKIFESEDFINDPIRDNFIVDVIQYDDKNYLLNLGNTSNTFIFLDIENLTTKKIIKTANTNNSLFRYSNIKLDKKIFLFGGKMSYTEGANEYTLGDEQHPFAIDELLPNGDGFFVNSVQVVRRLGFNPTARSLIRR